MAKAVRRWPLGAREEIHPSRPYALNAGALLQAPTHKAPVAHSSNGRKRVCATDNGRAKKWINRDLQHFSPVSVQFLRVILYKKV
jgi:hypothetical protein